VFSVNFTALNIAHENESGYFFQYLIPEHTQL